MFGLDPDTVRNIKQAFAKSPAIDKVILYGSRAKGNYRNGSDIDITLMGEKMGKNLTLNNSVYPLMDELEALNLPYMFDISIFSDIDNEHLIEHIHRVGKVFYQREKGLPDGWEVKRLGEVCEAKPPKKLAKGKLLENELVTFFPMSDLNAFNYYIAPYQTKKLKDVYAGYVYFENSDVLLAKITPCFENGKLGIANGLKNGVGFGSSEYIVLRPDGNTLSEYIYYFLSLDSIRKSGKSMMTGAVGHKRIPVDFILNKKLSIPPLHEQKRIVAILDQAFTAIDKAKANTEQNLKNAREVFQSELQTIFDNGKLRIDNGEWEEKKLREVTTILGDGLHGTPKYTDNGDYYFINGNNLDNGKIVFKEKTKKVSLEEYEKYNKNLNERTVFVSINGTLGNVAFYNKEKIILGKSACYFNLKKNIDKKFIKYVVLSPQFKKYMNTVSTGATIKNVSLKSMRDYKLNFPALNKQKQIAQKLDALSTETKKLETIYQQKITDLDELKKSILQKAFNGEL